MNSLKTLGEYIAERQLRAAENGMDYDPETDKFVPFSTKGSPKIWEMGDNAPQDPEQNWDEE